MIRVTSTVTIDGRALHERFIRASGPGGQNVNKVETAVQLRLVLADAGLPPATRLRLEKLAGRRLTRDHEIVITARRHRTQEQNRAEALRTLIALVRRAAVSPVYRVATMPSVGARRRRLQDKAHRSGLKQARRGGTELD